MKIAFSIVLLASAANAFAPAQRTLTPSALFAEKERGVSVDQDGKSNVWAIEPKMEVESTSAEEKTKGALVAGATLIAFAGAAGFALNNLPDPNQF